MKERSRWHKIPIYGAYLEVVVCRDIQSAHRRRKHPLTAPKTNNQNENSNCTAVPVISSDLFTVLDGDGRG